MTGLATHTCQYRRHNTGRSWNRFQRLQSVQNAAARLIYSIRRSEHITDALISLHWLRVQERIVFKVAVLTYRTVHCTAPPYLSSEFTRVADVTTRRRLRSSSTDQLIVPSHRLSTVGASRGLSSHPSGGEYSPPEKFYSPPNQALLTPPSGVVYHKICALYERQNCCITV